MIIHSLHKTQNSQSKISFTKRFNQIIIISTQLDNHINNQLILTQNMAPISIL